jgi:hypothetical protein
MNKPCGCRVNLNWPFLISQCEHGNLIEKKKSETDKAKREKKKDTHAKAQEALL